MCVVIDADTFSEISENNNKDFEPLRNWISQEGHTVIHGGSKYKKQLSNYGKFRSYLKELEHAGLTHILPKQEVDNTQEFLERNFILTDFNDHHIVAILFVSGCRVVSSHDEGLHKLIKRCCKNSGKYIIMKSMPNLKVKKPKIYQKESHKSFLNDSSISRCCI